ncbi:DUF6455 family protein [Hoeflea sp.]|uniref:DUF6455 family protein n=1 Tax=Hoeflea sp. TaxID=1940281 RepID=UPI003BAFEE62
MSVLDIFSRLTNRADLMDEMMDKLGVADEMQTMPDHAGVLRRAANRCLTCDKPDACQQWLKSEIRPDEAPYFCKNHDLFERVLDKMETEPAAS